MTGSAATGPIAVLIRHGDYHQRKNVPSALQPFPLTKQGEAQGKACGEDLSAWLSDEHLTLNPIVYSSCQLRAWQTARLACDVLIKHGHTLTIEQTPSLAERSVGSAANLTLDEIETILTEDPRFDTPPVAWKSDSDYCLPLQGAESLIMAGQRVADHLTRTTAQQPAGTVTLHFGHGASFRHAAHLLGVLTRDQIAQYSMHHARPLHLCHIENGTWAQTGGTWKIRQLTDKTLD
jgi:broad specificity phosphatase PhoE